MTIAATIIVAILALVYVYILVLEMFLRGMPAGLRAVRQTSRGILYVQATPAAMGLALIALS